MEIQLNNDQVTALMNQLPADAIGQAKGFDHIGSTLYIPDAYEAAATAIMAVAGWDQYVPPVPVPISISRRQFFMQLAIQNDITQAEALAAMAGTIPLEFETLIEALPSAQQFGARMAMAVATFDRNDPLVATFAAAKGRTSDQIDTMWRSAAAL